MRPVDIITTVLGFCDCCLFLGWSGGGMVLGKLPVPGHPAGLDSGGQGATALAMCAGGGCFDVFAHVCHFSSFSLLEDGAL